MKRHISVLLLLLPSVAAAQGLVLSGSTSAPAPVPGCVAVTSGGQTSYGCAAPGRARVPGAGTPPTVPPGLVNQNNAAPALGLYNQAATREQFGNQFGKSVTPQQVPPSHFTNTLVPPH